MMAELKRLLLSAGIEYTERVFASTDSIAGLTEPFVSYIVLYCEYLFHTIHLFLFLALYSMHV